MSRPIKGAYLPQACRDTIIIHYTAGANAESAIHTLCDRERKVSAHLVVGRDGAVTQLLPFNTIGWHAGRSHWRERTSFNQYSIGIEIDNAGPTFGARWPLRVVVRAGVSGRRGRARRTPQTSTCLVPIRRSGSLFAIGIAMRTCNSKSSRPSAPR